MRNEVPTTYTRLPSPGAIAMPLSIRCDCGKQLRVAEQHAGKRVKCPGCGRTVTVPDPEATTRTAVPPRIRFRCACGKAMQAKAEYAGQPVRCPECGKSVTIPGKHAEGKEEKSRIRAGQPAPRRGAPPPEEDWEEEERPARRKHKAGAKGSKLPLLLALGGVLFLLLAGGAAGAIWWFWNDKPTTPAGPGGPIAAGDPDPRDVDLVSADARVLAGIRAADLWQNDSLRNLYAKAQQAGGGKDLLAEMQKAWGLSPSQIARVLIVGVGPDTNPDTYLVMTTTVDYDRQKMLAQLPGAAPRQFAGQTYHVGQNNFGQPEALFFAGKKVFVTGPEPAVKSCLTALSKKKTETGLVADLEELLEDHQIAGVFKGGLPPATKQQLARQLPPPLKGAEGLLEFTKLTGAVGVGPSLTIRLSATFPDEVKAQQSKRQIDGLLRLATFKMGALRDEMKKAGVPEAEVTQAVGQIIQFLDSIQILQRETEVTATASTDLPALVQTTEKLIQSMAPPGRPPGPRPPGRPRR
jgi:ribosomal protein S27E